MTSRNRTAEIRDVDMKVLQGGQVIFGSHVLFYRILVGIRPKKTGLPTIRESGVTNNRAI
jgi:hypothetical protein